MSVDNKLGSMPISRLLLNMSLPACSGMLVIMLYNVVDTMFVGHFAGAMAIAGISAVLPVSILLPAVGMSIGIGSASVIARSLGAKNTENARMAFGNAISMTLVVCLLLMVLCLFFAVEILSSFGGRGEVLPYALEYYWIIVPGIPVLGVWMCMNNTLRAEGFARQAMLGMWLSSGLNVILDAVLIAGLDMGLRGAAIATVTSQSIALMNSVRFYFSGKSKLRIKARYFRWQKTLVKEILSLGATPFVRQSSGSIMVILINQSLFTYGGAIAVAVYGVLYRIVSVLYVPIIGMTQGFLPIAGYNYGAKQYDRVRELIIKSLSAGTVICSTMALTVWWHPEFFIGLFTSDSTVIELGSDALKKITLLLPLVAVQSIASAYYQAIGRPVAAFVLTLSRQVLLILPLYFLPGYLGLQGVWMSFPIADGLAVLVTLGYFLYTRRASLSDRIKDRQLAS